MTYIDADTMTVRMIGFWYVQDSVDIPLASATGIVSYCWLQRNNKSDLVLITKYYFDTVENGHRPNFENHVQYFTCISPL